MFGSRENGRKVKETKEVQRKHNLGLLNVSFCSYLNI